MSPLNINTDVIHCYFDGTAQKQHGKEQQQNQIR